MNSFAPALPIRRGKESYGQDRGKLYATTLFLLLRQPWKQIPRLFFGFEFDATKGRSGGTIYFSFDPLGLAPLHFKSPLLYA